MQWGKKERKKERKRERERERERGAPIPSITITSHWYPGSLPTYIIQNDFLHKPFIVSTMF